MFLLNEHLRQIRLSKNMTQKQVGEAIGTTDRHYQRYENGKSVPNLEYAVKLADVFDVSLDYLVGRSDDPQRH